MEPHAIAKDSRCAANPADTATRMAGASYMDDKFISEFLPARRASARKGQNGKILIVGGSHIYHGAPVLSSLAALRFGADLVYTAVPRANVSATRAISPDLIVIPMADAKLTRGSAAKLLGMTPTGLDSAAIGMGLAIQERGALLRLVKSLVDMDVRLVLDASALIPEVLPAISNTNSIVTPHAGEFKHMFGDGGTVLSVHTSQSDMQSRIDTVTHHAKQHGITILLKGVIDVVSDGSTTYLCKAGSPGMTTGGTGDVLAGITAGALAICRDPLKAASTAAYINGKAGETVAQQKGHRMLASDLIDAVPRTLLNFNNVINDHCKN